MRAEPARVIANRGLDEYQELTSKWIESIVSRLLDDAKEEKIAFEKND